MSSPARVNAAEVQWNGNGTRRYGCGGVDAQRRRVGVLGSGVVTVVRGVVRRGFRVTAQTSWPSLQCSCPCWLRLSSAASNRPTPLILLTSSTDRDDLIGASRLPPFSSPSLSAAILHLGFITVAVCPSTASPSAASPSPPSLCINEQDLLIVPTPHLANASSSLTRFSVQSFSVSSTSPSMSGTTSRREQFHLPPRGRSDFVIH
jgi:hypothetical protein